MTAAHSGRILHSVKYEKNLFLVRRKYILVIMTNIPY